MKRGAAFAALAFFLGCQDRDGSSRSLIGERADAVQAADRKILGAAQPFVADETLRAREEALRQSKRLRREAAWRTVEKILAPVALAESLPNPSRVPSWQTWYDREDARRVFHRLYDGLGPQRRRARASFTEAELDAAFAWNTRAVEELPNWPADRYRAYLASLDEAAEVAGVGGIARVAYSPATLRHLFGSYRPITDCLARGSSDAGSAWAPCLRAAFPSDAAVIKSSWVRADFGRKLPTYETSAEALAQRLSPDGGVSWETPDSESNPGPEAIYTLKLANGNTYRLAGLHLITKELDHWVWTTLWWSASPDLDFGADRPASIEGPWRHYKMCTVTAFDERDPAPGGGFDEHPSLAGALAAVHSGEGAPTWCSNPYIERGEGNASTNCVGCHQHAGTSVLTSEILSDAARFPMRGRTLLRSDFPVDYAWTVNQGERLGFYFADEMAFYDQSDPP
ncbi:hypothetical protein LZC95_46050 [Pendulispora brunnea]|uniref:Uncharacterized protein n=1 Tax=Pendulispora brunnea TaxID=2905690 RepID=A0ABZ2K536_9BACT